MQVIFLKFVTWLVNLFGGISSHGLINTVTDSTKAYSLLRYDFNSNMPESLVAAYIVGPCLPEKGIAFYVPVEHKEQCANNVVLVLSSVFVAGVAYAQSQEPAPCK